MALSEDQRAMLQLLLEGGQSYADIGALLGVDENEVRSRARGALTEIGGADPDSQVGLTDYLLGQADPIGRADVARQLQSDPGAAALASSLATQLRLIAPKGRIPDLPGQPASVAQPAEPPPGVPGGTPSGPAAARARAAGGARGFTSRVGGALRSLGDRDKRLPVILATAALLVIAVVLMVVNPFGGDDGDGGTDESSSASEDLTIVELQPLQGSSAAGQAVFARVGDQPVLQINLSGLEPTGKDENYIVWLYNSDDVAFPIARDRVGKDGNLTGTAPIPQELLSLLPQFTQIDVSLASNSDTQNTLKEAAQSQQLPPHTGESVLRGEIPRDPTEALGAGTDTGAGAGTTPAPPPAPTTPAPTTP